MSRQPLTTTVPNRKPFVRCPTFIDDVGPPPCEFFDETQSHLGAYAHALTGWRWSAQTADMEDSLATLHPPFKVRSNGCTIARTGPTPLSSIAAQGEHVVLSIGAGAGPWYWYGCTSVMVLGGDFLVSAKVRLDGAENFDAYEGAFIGLDPGLDADGNGGAAGEPYGFVSSGNSSNWIIATPRQRYDSGIPRTGGRWTVLQVSRNAGGIRFWIDGRVVRIPDGQGVLREGTYVPGAIYTRRAIRLHRTTFGAVTDLFYLDYFHRLCQRE